MNMDSMGQSFGPYGSDFCDYCGGNHFSYSCPSNPESHYFMRDNNWDTSHFNVYTQSWEEHPNFLLNNQDHGTFTSPPLPYQDWSNTYSNTFDQSWEKQVDFSGNVYGDDFNNSFLPPTPSLELIEVCNSFHMFLDDHIQSMQIIHNDTVTSLNNMTTCFEEMIRQGLIPIPSDFEISNCAGKDEGEVNTLVRSQEIKSFEEAPEHLSNPSSLQNSEEVQQNAKIVITPCFESLQEEQLVADTAEFLQQSCAENLQLVFKRVHDDQYKDPGGFIKSCSTVGEVMWKAFCGMKYSPIGAIEIWCHDQGVKHKWKEKHQDDLVRTVWQKEHTDVLQKIPPFHKKSSHKHTTTSQPTPLE